MQGTISKYNAAQRYGFITCERGEAFFHASTFLDDIPPCTGMMVNFEYTQTEKGAIAKNVTLLDNAGKRKADFIPTGNTQQAQKPKEEPKEKPKEEPKKEPKKEPKQEPQQQTKAEEQQPTSADNIFINQIKCNNCGADINIDYDNLIGFCPYCGAKLLIDINTIKDILKEKEITKREINKQQTELEMKKESNKTGIILFTFIFLIILLNIIFLLLT